MYISEFTKNFPESHLIHQMMLFFPSKNPVQRGFPHRSHLCDLSRPLTSPVRSMSSSSARSSSRSSSKRCSWQCQWRWWTYVYTSSKILHVYMLYIICVYIIYTYIHISIHVISSHIIRVSYHVLSYHISSDNARIPHKILGQTRRYSGETLMRYPFMVELLESKIPFFEPFITLW